MVTRQNLDRALALSVPGPLLRPPLRIEVAGSRRFLVRQCGIAVLLAQVDEDRAGVTVRQFGGFRSPIPPLTAHLSRRKPDWTHRFAQALAGSDRGPLHAGLWQLGTQHLPPRYCWPTDLPDSWPNRYVDWCDGDTPIIPLRPLSAPDAPRVKAYRRRAREGCLPPVLLWHVSSLDGWLVLDGHDRLVAANAEGLVPNALTLYRSTTPAHQAMFFEAALTHQRKVLTGAPTSDTGVRTAFEQQLVNLSNNLPFESARTTAWVSPGGAAEWERLWGNYPAAV
ncbi:hypothetical protein [Nocardia sp. NPDC058666]|uniref:hypothetical protein n=1 Tax=Nocardia sp. NPDC058666 TaxID=3346587 RepID=UPI003664ED4F